MSNVQSRIAKLEAELARMKAETGPGAQDVAPSVQQGDDGPTITTGTIGAGFETPKDAEFSALKSIVIGAYPVLDCEADEFKSAFIALSHFGRRDKLDTQRSAGWWIDEARARLRQCSYVGPDAMTLNAFVAAAVAHNDIGYSTLDRFPFEIAIALDPHGVGVRQATNAWRKLLVTRQVSRPIGALISASPPPQPARVFGGGIPLWSNTPDGRSTW